MLDINIGVSVFIVHVTLDRFCQALISLSGRDSSVRIAYGYGLDGPESTPGGNMHFRKIPNRAWSSPTFSTKVTASFPGLKILGRGADNSQILAPRSQMIRAISLLPLWGFGACYRAKR
jgi:hypothetical protein